MIALMAKENNMPVFLIDVGMWESLGEDICEQLSYDVCIVVILQNAWLCFESTNTEGKRVFCVLFKILKRYIDFFSVLLSEEVIFDNIVDYTLVEFNLDCLHGQENLLCWKYFLDFYSVVFKEVEVVAGRFLVVIGQIEQAVKRLKLLDEVSLPQALNICQELSGENFGGKVKRLKSTFTWSDLVTTAECKEALQTLCDLVKLSNVIYDHFGFGKQMCYGRSVSALFVGAPGTGKTMAAHVVANETGLPLYRVDLSQIINKYIGETEKSLDEVFKAAGEANVILFFDEADALFAKRTQVANSNDRFANVETSFLLQRIEDYSGVVILATNLFTNFDEAFKRRLKLLVNFTLPDEKMRLQLWHSVFPQEVDTSRLDMKYLAERFELSGSTIKSAALLAMFLCVRENADLTMEHVLKALKIEMSKSGQLILDKDFDI
jgi:AAA+ superfamily predicted ATPase